MSACRAVQDNPYQITQPNCLYHLPPVFPECFCSAGLSLPELTVRNREHIAVVSAWLCCGYVVVYGMKYELMASRQQNETIISQAMRLLSSLLCAFYILMIFQALSCDVLQQQKEGKNRSAHC